MDLIMTKEERDVVIIQLGARLDVFNEEMAESKDPSRIREIVEYTKPLISFRNKLINHVCQSKE